MMGHGSSLGKASSAIARRTAMYMRSTAPALRYRLPRGTVSPERRTATEKSRETVSSS